jgi:hypothetical protein
MHEEFYKEYEGWIKKIVKASGVPILIETLSIACITGLQRSTLLQLMDRTGRLRIQLCKLTLKAASDLELSTILLMEQKYFRLFSLFTNWLDRTGILCNS